MAAKQCSSLSASHLPLLAAVPCEISPRQHEQSHKHSRMSACQQGNGHDDNHNPCGTDQALDTHQYNGSDGSSKRQVGCIAASSYSKHDGHSDLRCEAQDRTADQQRAPSNLVNNEDSDDGCDELDTIHNDSCNEGTLVSSSKSIHTSKDLRGKEGDSIHTRPLPATQDSKHA